MPTPTRPNRLAGTLDRAATGGIGRRRFLALVGLGALWPAVSRITARRLPRIGFALASIEGAAAADLPAALRAIASIGYREVELGADAELDGDPLAVRRLLEMLSLTAPVLTIRMPDLFSNWRALLQQARLLGCRCLMCDEIPATQRQNLDGYEHVFSLLNAAGKITQWAGIQLAVRPHAEDFTAHQGIIPYERLIDRTDPVLVKLEMDVALMARVGREPLIDFTRARGRFVALRVGNVDETPAQRPEGLRDGRIPLAPVIAAAVRAGIEHYVVDDRRPGDPWGHAKADFDYLSELEFD